MVLISSFNLKQSRDFARKFGLKRWRHISGARSLIGTKRGENFIRVGEWWRNSRCNEIEKLISERELVQVFKSQLGQPEE